uniref:Odorant-binding protein 9 n=1 Tax=Meteorus pulchricornis TaxID=51522 RepID=A0A1S5VFH4_9HYME|nr:odorant-binding protein 9 [Meteorus pulchricornis]
MSRFVFNCVVIGILMPTFLVSAKLPDWVSDDMIEMVAEDKARCLGETGATQGLIDEVNEGKLPTDKSLACYMYCLFESLSLVDEDGVLDYEMIAGFLPDDMQSTATNILGACAAQPGADNCEKMYNIGVCVQAKDPSMFFML